jgi:hypothetical protein
MSHTILYRAMFAKVGNDQYIPLVEYGSNNCYVGKKRERNWSNISLAPTEGKTKLVYSRAEYMTLIDGYINEIKAKHVNQPKSYFNESEGYWTMKDIEQDFGYFSSLCVNNKRTSARMLRNFFERGFENAFDLTDKDCVCLPQNIQIKKYVSIETLETTNIRCATLDELRTALETEDADHSWVTIAEWLAESLWQDVQLKTKGYYYAK